MSTKAKINSQGRVVIPAECREAAGILPGAEVLIEVVGKGEIRLRTKQQAIRNAQKLVASHIGRKRDLVQELLADRRKEAARD
jgi:AbrB family looped-hinge helix DNA binding protein